MFAFSNCMPSEESSPSGSAKIRNALVEARCAQSDQLVPLFTADRAALGAEQKNANSFPENRKGTARYLPL